MSSSEVSDNTLSLMISGYTREAGVRQLEEDHLRPVPQGGPGGAGEEGAGTWSTSGRWRSTWGRRPTPSTGPKEEDRVGVAHGLAYTQAGGGLIVIESSVVEGKGKLILTGKLGEVMKESAQTAYSYVRSRAEWLDIDPKFYEKTDVHIHVPEGAVPKEGPSAGITIAVALSSALSKRPVRSDVAMTGEITLRGRVLPVGGIKEKVLAAHRAGISTVLLPKENEKDLREIPADVRRQLNIELVEHMDHVLELALRDAVQPEEPCR